LQNLIYLTYLAELLPLMLCLFFLRKIRTTELKVFFYYEIALAILLFTSLYFRYQKQDVNALLIVRRLFLLSEFIFLILLYSKLLVNQKLKKIGWLLIPAFSLYSFIDYINSKPGEFNYVPLVVESLLFLLVIIYYFYEKIQYFVAGPIYYQPAFWISVAFLIYFSGNFFLFLFSKSMINDEKFRIQYTLIYSTVTYIKNIFLCAAILVNANFNYQEKKPNLPIDVDLDTFNPLPNNSQTNH
jgi:hypothetical protein